MYALILTGGIGARLWPASTPIKPKPFLKINNQYTLLQNTILRANSLSQVKKIIIIGNSDHVLLIKQQYLQLKAVEKRLKSIDFIAETVSNNTMPAILAANLYIKQNYGNQQILILPSDHIIKNFLAFQQAVNRAIKKCQNNKIVLFGIKPSCADPNYGYIKYEKNRVIKFIEKPSAAHAEKFLYSKNYQWNSGMVLANTDLILSELSKFAPDNFALMQNIIQNSIVELNGTFRKITIGKMGMERITKNSFDHAILEKTNKISLVKCPENIGWSDVGNWDSIAKNQPCDDVGNNITGNVITHNVTNCYIQGGDKPISAIGVNDLAIIETKNGILVINKQNASDVSYISDITYKKDNIANE